MAIWEGSFQSIDPLSFNAIVELQLEDSLALAGAAKGKQRAGMVTDAELALDLYAMDLKACQDTLADRKMSQSIAIAVIRDGEMIRQAYEHEDQLARDRQLAMSLDGNDSDDVEATATDEKAPVEDPWSDEEMLAKVSAIYNEALDSADFDREVLDESDEADGAPQAESSAFASSRQTRTEPKLGHCVACAETKDFFDVARVPCNHEYCRECLASLFRASMTDETLFPPRCDGQVIPLSRVRFFLQPDLAKEFESKSVELSSKNRVYCHDPHCSTFIPQSKPDETEKEWVACPQCNKTTCTICKAASHTGDCPDDVGLQKLVETANNEQWQRCYQCHRFVELDIGCNHMTCPCGAQFCYICGAKWKTCGCPEWVERNLYARAAMIADRGGNPRRQLFQLQRAPLRQPTPPLPLAALPTAGRAQSVGNNDGSEWEQDWPDAVSPTSDDADSLGRPSSPAPRQLEPPTEFEQMVWPFKQPRPISNANQADRDRRIAGLVDHLREYHICAHEKWRWVRGPHECEECHYNLPNYIFECKQCHLQACNRCRRNRLS